MGTTGPAKVSVKTAGGTCVRTQVITLAVDTLCTRADSGPLLPLLLDVEGVEAVAPDPASERVWVFGNGTVEPEGLIDALAAWGFGSYVLEQQFKVLA